MNKTNKEIKKELLTNNGFIELSSVFNKKYNNKKNNNLFWWQKLIIKLLEIKERTRKTKIEEYLRNNKGEYKNKFYINNLTELPTNCKTCKLRNETKWTCNLVEWNHNLPISHQNIKITEKEWYDGNWKHPDCPLREINI